MRISLQTRPTISYGWAKLIQKDIEKKTEAYLLWPVAHLITKEGNLGKSKRPQGLGAMVKKEVEEAVAKNMQFLNKSRYFVEGINGEIVTEK